MSSGVAISRLFGYECRRVLRSPVVWTVLALLLVAGRWGALNTARVHAKQAADVTRMEEEEAAWYADVRQRAARYARPSAPAVPYWQDPTGASGFSRYFLRRFAAKPHLPLSVLAVGQSDLQPFAVPLRLETLFGGDRVYDYQPPRALATGIFDLSFVLVFVLPLCIGTAVAVVGAHERDQGILPLVAAQPVVPRTWWAVRLAALATILVPGVASTVVAALAIAGVPILQAEPETHAAVALVSGHTLLWLAIAGWSLVRGQGAVGTVSIVAAVWIVLSVAVPLAGTLAVQVIAGRPSTVDDVDELRRTTDEVQRQADGVVVHRLAAYLGAAAASIDAPSLDYATRLTLITEEMEARLEWQEKRREHYARTTARVAAVVSRLSPQMALHTALTDLAGTGTARHRAFLTAVREFQLELRAFMYPRVLEPLRSPAPRECGGCPARLTFTDYESIPRFRMTDTPRSARVASACRTAGWLAVLAGTITTVGIGRGRKWALAS
jgi:ABC-2 type transport system permease protein